MINLFLFAGVVVLLVMLSMLWPPDSPWAPWWRTSRRIARAMCRMAGVRKTDVIYDLGSGDGSALLTAAEEYGAKGVGIEIDPSRVWISQFRAQFQSEKDKVHFLKQNFFDVELSDATVIFVYLVPKALLRLKFKFAKELTPGTRIVSFRYQIPYLPLVKEDKLHQLYLYKIPKDFVQS